MIIYVGLLLSGKFSNVGLTLGLKFGFVWKFFDHHSLVLSSHNCGALCQLFPPLVATTQQTAAVDGRYTDSHRHGAAASRPQTDRVVISVRRSVSLGSSVRPIFSRVRRATRRGCTEVRSVLGSCVCVRARRPDSTNNFTLMVLIDRWPSLIQRSPRHQFSLVRIDHLSSSSLSSATWSIYQSLSEMCSSCCHVPPSLPACRCCYFRDLSKIVSSQVLTLMKCVEDTHSSQPLFHN